MLSPTKFLLSTIFIVLVLMGFIGHSVVKPLHEVVFEHNQLIVDCEAKIPRDQFCELVAIPKVKK